jgi:hypothetical protein
MFLTHTVLGNTILERVIFWTLKEATKYANEKAREKIWTLHDNTVYFGDVEVRVYKPHLQTSSDYRDQPILIIRN